MPPKWFVIARNEYRLLTSSIRPLRPFFPFLVIILLAVFVVYIAPYLVNLFVNEIVAFLLSQAAVIMLQVMLFITFLFFVWFPVSLMLRDIRSEQQGILLSAPIRSSDILLGEYLGELPLYAIIIAIITGLFTALLDPLKIDILQKGAIVAVFVITLSCALWIGTVIAAVLRTKLGRTSRGRDIGKSVAVLIAIPFVGIMYAFIGGGVVESLSDPASGGILKSILAIFPSSWGADIISLLASNPGNSGAIALNILTRFAGIIIFFGIVLWIGVRIADRAYTMELTSFTAAQAAPDGVFYKTIKSVGGGSSFGTLLVSTLKVYGRRFQNLSWVAYTVMLAVLINIFLIKPEDPVPVVMMSSFIIALLAAVVASDLTLRGKETLLLYKKIPSGVGKLIKMRLAQGWVIVIPVVAVVTGISLALLPEASFLTMIKSVGLVLVTAVSYVVLALGVFLLLPAYTEKGGEFMLNLMIIIQGSVFLYIGCLIIFDEFWGSLMVPLLSWLLGSALLVLGKRHLEKME